MFDPNDPEYENTYAVKAPPQIRLGRWSIERNAHPTARGHRYGMTDHRRLLGVSNCRNPIAAAWALARFIREHDQLMLRRHLSIAEWERRQELHARWRWAMGFIVAVVIFTVAAAAIARAHTPDEIREWRTDWVAQVDAAGGLTPELLEVWLEFDARHQPLERGIQAAPRLQPPAPRTYAAGVEQWRTAIAAYDWPVDTMLRIMACESGGNPYAASHTDDHGLLQIHWPIWGPHFGVTRDQLYDPATNIDIAWRVYSQQGLTAWVCY